MAMPPRTSHDTFRTSAGFVPAPASSSSAEEPPPGNAVALPARPVGHHSAAYVVVNCVVLLHLLDCCVCLPTAHSVTMLLWFFFMNDIYDHDPVGFILVVS